MVSIMSLFTLMYWLGPWTDQEKSPSNITREGHKYRSLVNDDLWIYRGLKSRRPLFLIPGIQHLGPNDPRLDRFARVLAASGYVVGVPALPTMIGLRMEEALLEDTTEAFLSFSALFQCPSAVFSISASSIAALYLGAKTQTSKKISQMMLFGGFYHWAETLNYAITGKISKETSLRIDPLNLPVVLLNVIEDLPLSEKERPLLCDGWREFVEGVWEDPEFQHFDQYSEVALDIAKGIPKSLQSIFLMGCSVEKGGVEYAKTAITQCTRDTTWLDPVPLLQDLRCPLHIAHGREDGVVPYTDAKRIAKHVPSSHVYLTGLAHHAGVNKLGHYLWKLPQLFVELLRSISLVHAMSNLWEVSEQD
jgi:pimeloyl-ACP methyl ester carboxylesterase